ncbi:MAG TPA: hypothetical protein VI653_02750 [Steroidobacteraceae bacterium]
MAVPTLADQPAAMSPKSILTRTLLALLALLPAPQVRAAVSVDLLYDLRHTSDPRDNANNFPVVELKLFYPRSFGSFLMKEEIDLDGSNHNVSQTYTELSQSIKLGKATLLGAPIYAHLGYSGGLGVFGNASGGFYIQNAFNAGLEYPFQVAGAYCNAFVALRHTSFAKPSYDPMLSLYAGRSFFNSRLLVAHSLEAWTTSNNQGTASTQHDTGKLASWELESELWYKVATDFSVGTYIRTTRNVYALSNRWVVYPSFGVRYAF